MVWKAATATFVVGLGVNVIAAHTVPPLALSNLGPLALAWHERGTVRTLLGVLLVLVMLLRAKQPVDRAILSGILGAGCAQVASLIWFGGASPDYLVIIAGDYGAIINMPDLLMTVGVLALIAAATIRALRVRWRGLRSPQTRLSKRQHHFH